MKAFIFLIIVGMAVSSCALFCNTKPEKLNSKTHYFRARPNADVTVISEIPVNSDTLKTLLVVPNEDYYFEMGKNLEYFNEVMTYNQLQDKILELGDTLDLRLASPDKLKLNKATRLYKHFVILERLDIQRDEHYAWVTGLSVYDPLRGEIIFENRIPDDAIRCNKGFYFPLFNSFLRYLRKQK